MTICARWWLNGMRKLSLRRAFLVLVILSTLFSVGATVTARGFIGIAVNDQLVSFPDALPEVRDDLAYVPVRLFSQAMGAAVDWSEEKQQVTISKFGRQVIVDLRHRQLTTQAGKAQPCPVYVKNDRVMAPFRQIASLFGYGVSYVPEGPLARAFIDLACKRSDTELLQQVAAELKVQQDDALRQEPPPSAPAKKETGKVAYLTIDDGPSASTDKILDILAKHEVKATFFMLEGSIWGRADSVRRIVNEGHAAGLHGSTHVSKSFYTAPSSAVTEMDKCNAALEAVTGVRSGLIRVPFGSKPNLTADYRDALVKAGYHLWDWNVDTFDSRSAVVAADKIIAAAKEQIPKKDQAIILMHDRPSSVEALPSLIEFLKESGYAIKPLSAELTPLNFWGDKR